MKNPLPAKLFFILSIFLGFFFISVPLGYAAIYLDTVSSKDSGTGGASQLTWNHTVTIGASHRLIIVGVSIDDNTDTTVTSVTYGGQSLSQVPGATATYNAARVDMWYRKDPLTGINSVQVNLSRSTQAVGGATSYTGVDQTTPFGTACAAANRSGTASCSVSSAADELVVDVVCAESTSATLTVGANQTQRYKNEVTNARAGGSTEPGAASVTMSWTISATKDWAIAAVPIKPVSGGTTLAALSSFEASAYDEGVMLQWRTGY